MEKKKNISSVGIMLLLYITLWSCNNNAVILYGGYAILMFFTISKLFFSEKGAVIEIYTPTKHLFIFMCFCFASIFWALNKNFAFQKCIFIFACVMLVIIMTNYFIRIKSVDSLLFTIAVMGIAIAIYVIIFEGGFSAFYSKATSSVGQVKVNKARVGVGVNNPNFIGIQCAYSAVVWFYYALLEKKRICYLIMLLPSVVCMASGSKVAFLIFASGIFLLLYFHQREEKGVYKYLKVLIGIVLLVVAIERIFSLDIMHTMKQRVVMFIDGLSNAKGTKDMSTQLRIDMIRVGIEQIFNSPALGIGLGNSFILNASKLGYQTYSHNDYIEHLINGGLIGFLLYYRIFIHLFIEYKKLMKKDKDPKLVVSYIIMLLLLISNIGTINYYNKITVYLFFILWISQIQIKKENILL